MTWSTSYISSLIFAALLMLLPGSAYPATAVPEPKTAPVARERIAVLPVHNLSGSSIPAKEIRQAIIDELGAIGIPVWSDETFDRFMLGNRIRYSGGVDTALSKAFRSEGRIRGVLVTTVELYEGGEGPKIALTCRMVNTGERPEIEWIDSVALTGFDNPGILDLGRIRDMRILRGNALHRIANSLGSHLTGDGAISGKSSGRHSPKILHRKESLEDIEAGKSILVLPFTNDSPRKHAGEIIQLRMVHQLFRQGFKVIEPGIVRDELLRRRIIFDRGVSITQADLLLNISDADFIMGGTVQTYDDSSREKGRPEVYFSALAIAPGGNRIVWSSSFRNHGDEGVYFFDWGRILTASELASSMAASAIKSFQHH